MIAREEAKEIAMEVFPEANYYEEYKRFLVLSCMEDLPSDGGGLSPIAINKRNGKSYPFAYAVNKGWLRDDPIASGVL